MKAEMWNVTVGSGKDERRMSVHVEYTADGACCVEVDGEKTTVRVVQLEPGCYSLLDEAGRQRTVELDGTLPELKASFEGRDAVPVVVKNADVMQTSAAAGESSGSRGDVVASMPGKVVKVLVKEGDEVRAGQPLFLIEAMKMENELRAPRNGKVLSIAVREGQTVEAGFSLLHLGGST